MATRTKVRGNGKVNTQLALFLEELRRLQFQLSGFLGENKTRTLRNMSGETGHDVMTTVTSVSTDMAHLQQIACRAMMRSINQKTAVGGSRTRRRRADGTITGS